MRMGPRSLSLFPVTGLLLGGISLLAPVGSTASANSGSATGYTAYIANSDGTATPINTKTDVAGTPISAGVSTGDGAFVAITPDGKTAYYADVDGNTVTPINASTNVPGSPINLPSGPYPDSIAVAPNGQMVYVTDYNNQAIPISTSTNQAGTPIQLPSGCGPYDIAITPDGQMAYVPCVDLNALVPIDLTTSPPTVRTPIGVGTVPGRWRSLPTGRALTSPTTPTLL